MLACGILKLLKAKRATTAPRRSHPLGFMIRQIAANAKLTDETLAGVIETSLQQRELQAVVTDLAVTEQRRRKLPAELTLLFVVVMNLFPRDGLHQVLIKLFRGLRFIWPDPDFVTATKGAICKARYRLGTRPAVELFHRVCQPMATEATRGAFLGNLRLMAVDGTTEDVADTRENERVFGRHQTDRGASAFPQVLGIYLVECGTHAIVDAGFWPCHASERKGGLRLLRSVVAGMLLMWDCGFHSYKMARCTRARSAHFLGRVSSTPRLKPIRRLSDGSYLAYLHPDAHGRSTHGQQLLVRVIEYTLDDPALVGYGERHRLVTSLLNSVRYPAVQLVCTYHERWEWELAVDEIDTHQRLLRQPLRSEKPVGVIQELYGLLIAHYAVRKLMHEAALKADLDPDRLSFSNAVRIIGDAIPEFQMVVPEQRTALYQRLLVDIARHRSPPRANRINPRVVKRKMSKYPLKRAEHRRWPQPCKPFPNAVVMLK